MNNVPHRIGGILRDVSLFALPSTHLTRMHAETDLDATWEDATLKLQLGITNGSGTVEFVLTDPLGTNVAISPSSAVLSTSDTTVEIPVANPLKWDAEHPHLYTLQAILSVGGEPVQTLTRKIGFREIEMDGNRMLVNGQEVKLRGGCRHSIHPLAGRADVPGLDETDIRLYKEANLNYIRTSHYPTTPRFLELCDEYGMYVEEEMAICWIDHHAAQGVLDGFADDLSKQPLFISAIADTIERDLSHPSIIIWSLGNENTKWGPNFEAERDYARIADPSRPLKTGHNHYGDWSTDEHLDLDSLHYPSWSSDFDKEGKPYIFDEYAHVITYYGPDSVADNDPNIRNFWGESLKRFWDDIFPSQGSLGAAIWGTVDEVFLTPDAAIGYGRWGIFDGWRRLKPEYWLTMKAYSPVRIANEALGNPGSGNPLHISVTNWFDHTDFNELEITWAVGDESGTLTPSLAPHTAGVLVVPGRAWQDDDVLQLTFTAHQPGYSYLVNELRLPLVEHAIEFPGPLGPAPSLAETESEITVTGDDCEIIFDKATGTIRSASYGGDLLLTSGPSLNLTPFAPGPFTLSSITAGIEPPFGVVEITGSHGDIGVAYTLRIDRTGIIKTTYTVTDPPVANAYSEVGISFGLADDYDRLTWDRKGLYSVYPPDHIGRNQGVALKTRPGPEQAYRQEPDWPWAFEMKDFHQHGTNHAGYGATHDFRGMKENIRSAAVGFTSGRQVRVEPTNTLHAVRIGKPSIGALIIDDRDPAVVYSGTWYQGSASDNYFGTETYANSAGASVSYPFTGTSIRWIGALNHHHGKADVYLDDTLVAEAVDCYAPGRQAKQVLFEAIGLSDASHTLKVVVRGDRNPESTDSWILIDGFSDVPPEEEAETIMLHINRHWAYALGWGNYNRTSQIDSGFSDTVSLRLMDAPPPATSNIVTEIQIPPEDIAAGHIQLEWSSNPLAFYQIEFSEDLALWTTVNGYVPSGGEQSRYAVDLNEFLGYNPDQGFFRIGEL